MTAFAVCATVIMAWLGLVANNPKGHPLHGGGGYTGYHHDEYYQDPYHRKGAWEHLSKVAYRYKYHSYWQLINLKILEGVSKICFKGLFEVRTFSCGRCQEGKCGNHINFVDYFWRTVNIGARFTQSPRKMDFVPELQRGVNLFELS